MRPIYPITYPGMEPKLLEQRLEETRRIKAAEAEQRELDKKAFWSGCVWAWFWITFPPVWLLGAYQIITFVLRNL